MSIDNSWSGDLSMKAKTAKVAEMSVGAKAEKPAAAESSWSAGAEHAMSVEAKAEKPAMSVDVE